MALKALVSYADFGLKTENVALQNVKTTINIYTQNGHFITSLHDERINNFIAIEWDARDSKSKSLPNGTYLYTLNANIDNQIYKKSGVFSIIR